MTADHLKSALADGSTLTGCPSCYRYGAPHATRLSQFTDHRGEHYVIDLGIVPDPSCSYCGGKGTVEVQVSFTSTAEQAEAQPLF